MCVWVGGGGEKELGRKKGTCKSFIQDLRFNGQCVCVWGGGGKSYQPGVYVPLMALFLVSFIIFLQ